MGRKARGEGWNRDDCSALRERLVALRLRPGLRLTQTEVAKKLGVTASYVSQLERGVAPLTIPTIRQLAGVYDVSPAPLFAMLRVQEFDWLAMLVDAPEGRDPLDNPSEEEREELVSYLLYLRVKKGLQRT